MAELTKDELHDLFMSIDFRDDDLGNAPVVVKRIVDRRVNPIVAVLAEMERHAPLPNPTAFYAAKLRAALGVTGPLTCACGSCLAAPKAGA